MMNDEARYPIREVSRLTGVNSVTLRAWQRRYGLLKTERTESGHRLFTQSDIERVKEILSWLERGVSIGKVRVLLDKPDAADVGIEDAKWQEIIEQLLAIAVELKLSKLEAELRELSRLYPAELLLREIVEPWLKRIDALERVDQKIIRQSCHALTRRLFIQRLNLQNGPRVAVFCVGLMDDLASTLACFELQSLGCRVVDLGIIDPGQLRLAEDRLKVDGYLVVMGAGLNKSWFKAQSEHWRENTFFTGEVGKIYSDKGLLPGSYALSVSQLAREVKGAPFSRVDV